MKNKLSALSILLSLAACKGGGLNPDPGPTPGPDPVDPVTLTLNSVFEEAEKTSLGELKDGVFPVYWTDGDRVCVNGYKSSTLYNLPPKTSQAEFSVQGPVAPYHIIYPSIICDAISEDGIAALNIPVAQTYKKGSFGSMSAILYGSTEGTQGELKNLCGVVRIPLVKGADWGANIKSISVSSSNSAAPLAGGFTLDTATGELTAVDGSSTVLLSLPAEGVNLSEAEPEYFYLALPNGAYPDGFTITLNNDEGSMLCQWKDSTAIPAGIVVTIDTIAFKPNNTKYIDSIDSWNEFAAAVNDGNYERWVDPDTGEANVVGDISFGGDLTCITALPTGFVLNGGGHVIKRASATEPLILLINEGATVKNLTVAGTRTGFSATSANDRGTGNLAAFNRGTIENCTNDMSVSISSLNQDVKIGGMVTDNAGVIKDCKNNADITLNFNISANRAVYGGTFAAIAHRNIGTDLYCGDFINCENKGSIVIKRVSAAGTSASGYSLIKFALGGIVGCVEQGTKAGEHTLIQNCTNSGNVIYYQDERHTNANYSYSVGGILGRNCDINTTSYDYYYKVGGANTTSYNGYYVDMQNCTNTGTVDASIYSGVCSTTMSAARLVFVGGLVGCLQSAWDSPADVKGCTVNSILRAGNAVCCDVTGGLFGGLGYANVEDCKANVTIGLSKNDMVPATKFGYGGGIAGVVLRDATVKNCEAAINYDNTGALDASGAGYVGVVLKHSNIQGHVASTGYATLTLEGNNCLSGTIKGADVTESNITVSGSAGKIIGSISIK